MTRYPELFTDLASPFGSHEVKTRSQAGRQFAYVTARTVMNRLDEVVGPENWWDEYVPAAHSVLCRLSVRMPDGSVIVKQDAGGMAGMSDPGDDDKSAYSDSFKRAAAKFGVGRYLYNDGIPNFSRANRSGSEAKADRSAPSKVNSARGESEESRSRADCSSRPVATQRHVLIDRHHQPVTTPHAGRSTSASEKSGPRSGRALFAWVKEREEQEQMTLLGPLNRWASQQDFPGRMIDWDSQQVHSAWKQAKVWIEGGELAGASEPEMAIAG